MGDATGQQEYPGNPGWDCQAGWAHNSYPQPGYTETTTPWPQQSYPLTGDQVDSDQEPGPPGEERPASQNECVPYTDAGPPGVSNQGGDTSQYFYPQQPQHQPYPSVPQTNGYPPNYNPYPYPPQPSYDASGYDYSQAQAPSYQPQPSGQNETRAPYGTTNQYDPYSGYYSQPAYETQQAYQPPQYASYPNPETQQYTYPQTQWPEYAAPTPGEAAVAGERPVQDTSAVGYDAAGGYVPDYSTAPGNGAADANGPKPSYASVVSQGQAANMGVTPEAALSLATHLFQLQQQNSQQQYQHPPPPPPPSQPPAQSPQPHQAARQQGGKEWSMSGNKLQIFTNPRLAGNWAGKQKPLPKEAPPGKPAYVKVEGETAAVGQPGGGEKKASEFPPALRGYVQRCFERCKTDEQRKGVEVALQEIIRTATQDGTVGTTDWDTKPYPPILTHPLLSPAKRSAAERKSRWDPEPSPSTSEPEKKSRWGAEKDVSSNGHSGLFSRLGLKKSKNMTWVRGQSPEKEAKSKPSPRGRKRTRKAKSEVDDRRGSSNSESETSATPRKKSFAKATPEEINRREQRSRRFDGGDGKKGRRKSEPVAGEASLRKDRAALLMAAAGEGHAEDVDWSTLTVKGTSQTVEKRFLRLTAAPDPTTVRPEPVLHKALAMVETTEKDYYYRCDQLKSMRQDLTVQRIRNAFTVRVYETHARMALEFGDMAEFNQCQAQLKILYREGLPGCIHEFAAYRLLYIVFHQTAGSADLLFELKSLNPELKASHPVSHALEVRAAYSDHNYVAFFRLYDTAPNLNKRLLDLRVDKVRFEGVKRMTKAFRPHVQVTEVARALGFAHASNTSTDVTPEQLEDCEEWLTAHGATVVADKGELLLDTKASQNNLFVPAPAEAVAHGDANLAAEAFFAKGTFT